MDATGDLQVQGKAASLASWQRLSRSQDRTVGCFSFSGSPYLPPHAYRKMTLPALVPNTGLREVFHGSWARQGRKLDQVAVRTASHDHPHCIIPNWIALGSRNSW